MTKPKQVVMMQQQRLRKIRKQQCKKKIRFESPEQARAESNKLRIEWYPCEFCGGYHIGSRNKIFGQIKIVKPHSQNHVHSKSKKVQRYWGKKMFCACGKKTHVNAANKSSIIYLEREWSIQHSGAGHRIVGEREFARLRREGRIGNTNG